MAINTTQFMNDLAQFNKNATKNEKFYNSELQSILDKHAHQRERKKIQFEQRYHGLQRNLVI